MGSSHFGWYATVALESRPMTHFYDIDAADAAIPELDGILVRLGGQRAELVRLRGEVLTGSGPGERASSTVTDRTAPELRLTRLRMQGLIDQMAADVARIDELGLTLRDIERGLVDFPALVSGRQIWLCWQRGDRAIGWWHSLDTGFAGRLPLSEIA